MKRLSTREKKYFLLILGFMLLLGSFAYAQSFKKQEALFQHELEKEILPEQQMNKEIDQNQDQEAIKNENVQADANNQMAPQAEIQNPVLAKLVIDIKGEVKRPGVYELDEGSRVIDAINLAGGVTDQGVTTTINLAEKLQDGMVIYIPSQKELEKGNVPQLTSPTSGSVEGNNSSSALVNINKATASELTSLPGIGPSKAEAIIKHREKHGPFKKKEDLLKVSGIGPKLFERVKDLIEL